MLDQKRKKIVKRNAAFRLTDNIVYFIFTIVVNYFLLMFFDTEYAGLYATITSLTVIFFSLVTGVLQYYGQKIYKPLEEGNKKQLSVIFWSTDRDLKNMAVISFIAGLTFALIYSALTYENSIFGFGEIVLYFVIFYISRIASISTVGKYWILFMGDEKMYLTAMANTTTTLILFVSSYFLLSTGMFWAFLFVYMIRTVVLYSIFRFMFFKMGYATYIKSDFKYRHYLPKMISKNFTNFYLFLKSKIDKKEVNYKVIENDFYIKDNLKNSRFSIFHAFSNNALAMIPLVLIPIFVALEENAIYGYYYVFYALVSSFILSTLETSVGPTIGRIAKEGKLSESIVSGFLNIFMFIALSAGIIYVIITPYMVNSIYGSNWTGNESLIHYALSLVMALSIFAYFGKRYFIMLTNSLGKFKETIKNTFFELSLYILLVILVPLTLYLTNVDDFIILISFPLIASISYFVRSILESRYILFKNHDFKLRSYYKEMLFYVISIILIVSFALIANYTNFMSYINIYSPVANIFINIALIIGIVIVLFFVYKKFIVKIIGKEKKVEDSLEKIDSKEEELMKNEAALENEETIL